MATSRRRSKDSIGVEHNGTVVEGDVKGPDPTWWSSVDRPDEADYADAEAKGPDPAVWGERHDG